MLRVWGAAMTRTISTAPIKVRTDTATMAVRYSVSIYPLCGYHTPCRPGAHGRPPARCKSHALAQQSMAHHMSGCGGGEGRGGSSGRAHACNCFAALTLRAYVCLHVAGRAGGGDGRRARRLLPICDAGKSTRRRCTYMPVGARTRCMNGAGDQYEQYGVFFFLLGAIQEVFFLVH